MHVPLDIIVATGPLLEDWRAIHNAIIPTAPLSATEVAERAARNRLTLAYVSAYLEAELAHARAAGARRIETTVLASNTDGLAFALSHGFVEYDRYVLEGDTIAFVDLHLPADDPASSDSP